MRTNWCMAGLAISFSVSVFAAANSGGTTTLDTFVRGGDAALSPVALAISPDAKTLYVGCATAHEVLFFDLERGQVATKVIVPGAPLGMILSRDGERLYVTCAAPHSTVCVVDTATGSITRRIAAGYYAMGPVLSPDEQTLFVCNRFNHDVSIINLETGKEISRVPVAREPVAAAVTTDGRHLLVANHLQPTGPKYGGIGVVLSVIDVAAGRVSKEIQLPRGSNLIKAIAVSPDGRYAAVTHLIARYYLPTKDVDAGAMNCNALSIVDLRRLELLGNVLLDEAHRGAANPWGVAWSPDGKSLYVSHAGTHEISVVEVPARISRPYRVRERIALPGNGPRALVATAKSLYVANYFSDTVCAVNLEAEERRITTFSLGTDAPPSQARLGEAWFNDARLCRGGWQSCASCHDADARMDGIKWDLLNDGLGNPKNAKSLLYAHLTPPAMAKGVRADAEAAVRAGIKHILFSEQPEEVPQAILAYLKSLQPLPSPHLVDGRPSEAAQRGEFLFKNSAIGCARCHQPPLRSDGQLHDVGTNGRFDPPEDTQFDTPALVELWRTAPYLHDGSAASPGAVFTTRNPNEHHGKTSHLTAQQIEDLEAFLLSL